jgi:hypothetical protein
VCTGSGALSRITGSLGAGETDLYRIAICDAAHFSATTIAGTYLDTALYLFDGNGQGVAFNDDESGPTSQSLLTSALLAAPGNYYLAVAPHGRQPLDSAGRPIWQAEPATAERGPDGSGAAGLLAQWTGSPSGGDYRIMLTGACFAAAPCGIDFNGDGDAGTDADIVAFFHCLAGDCCQTCGSADYDGDGDIGTDRDLEAFFHVLGGGPC